jgi:uncharacterized membrane protein (DUF4010 family)
MKGKIWIKPTLILLTLFAIGWISPAGKIDPWKLLSPKKIANLIFALAFVQTIGFVLIKLLGTQIGALLTGFLGGLVSSTATTASLARKSFNSVQGETPAEMLTFLSATLAMLLEAVAITLYGTGEIHWTFFLLFSGPVLATLVMIIYQMRKASAQELILPETQLNILPIIKLAAFVVGVLTASKLLQEAVGQAGLLVLTFFVSLFEIHGSVIANLQLHEAGTISVKVLGGLLAVSVVASYFSKLFLVVTLGSASLKRSVVIATIFLFLSLAGSESIFYLFEK